MKTVIVIGLGMLGLYLGVKSFIDKLIFSVAGISFVSEVNGSELWNVKLKFSNPTFGHITISGFNVDFFFQGKKIGNITRSGTFVIPANNNVIINATLTVPITEFSDALRDAFTSFITANTTELKIAGSVKLYGFSLPIKTTYAL